jgi:hypothetical protein
MMPVGQSVAQLIQSVNQRVKRSDLRFDDVEDHLSDPTDRVDDWCCPDIVFQICSSEIHDLKSSISTAARLCFSQLSCLALERLRD